MKKNLILALLLFLLACFPRLHGIKNVEPQSDELHWQKRSYGIMLKYRKGETSDLTTHLNHPGIPASIAMAVAQAAIDKFNSKIGLIETDLAYFDHLSSARIGAALTSALLIPLIYLLALPILGSLSSFLAAALIAISPQHVALSRLAHIDTTLGVCALLSIFSFWYALEKRSVSLKILAGFFWGLCIATKPTAGCLALAFFLLKPIKRFTLNEKKEEREALITWSDYYAIWTGLLTFSLLYTRLWKHYDNSSYKLTVANPFKTFVYNLGTTLHNSPGISISIALLAVFGLLLSLVKHRKGKFSLNPSLVIITFLSIFIPLIFVPQVLENIIGFWTWAVGLAGESHVAWGRVWTPPRYGYVGLYLSKIPSLIIIGFLFGMLGLLREKNKRVVLFFSFSLIVIFTWTIPLSVSSKQTYRYVIPVVPFIFCIAAYGFHKIAKFLVSNRLMQYAFVTCIFLAQTIILLRAYPNYILYYNQISGGLKAVKAKNQGLPFVGQNYAVDFFHAYATKHKKPLKIGVLGDVKTINYAYERLYPKNRNKIVFTNISSPSGLDFVVSYGSFHNNIPVEKIFEKVGPLKTSFIYQDYGVSLLTIYQVPIGKYETPYEFNLTETGSSTGTLRYYRGNKQIKSPKSKKTILGIPGKHPKGFLLYGLDARVKKGSKYRVKFTLGLPQNIKPRSILTPERLAARVDFGSICNKTITFGELSDAELKDFELDCDVVELVRRQIRVYWFGNVPLIISKITLEAL